MLKLGFINVGRVDSYIEGRGDIAASRYFDHLNFIGKHALSVIAASAMLRPDPAYVLCVLLLLAVWVVYKGREYRKHLDEILEIYSGWKILRLLAKAWLFLLAVAVVDALLVGLLDLSHVAGIKAWGASFLLGAFK